MIHALNFVLRCRFTPLGSGLGDRSDEGPKQFWSKIFSTRRDPFRQRFHDAFS
jgi:hypothetical protein